ncbi:MAG TPA: M3 family metallopeptidase [Candidatus Cloacimonadota bacterium]|jgi:Zn-dependent oligopeptidase|nr:M3 family metallopeptidase [Candidatus Cloacimonadales bacterium]HPY96686.1 M3 family metallopeptidase [Candidatus Cloacimonadota bacterium]HQB41231.1 M3 family metallopeptidase [Candidatus Cloacimonadota bacterium]
MNNNPFFEKWNTPFDSIPFHLFKKEHYVPAIDKGLEGARKGLKELKENNATPTFENTILPLEVGQDDLGIVTGVFFNLLSAESDDEFKQMANEISPKLASLSSEVFLDDVIFQKVKHVYENQDGLNAEQKRLVAILYKRFIRNGALLDPEKKKKLEQIDQELSVLSPSYSRNVLNSTNSFIHFVDTIEELDGMPESAKQAAKELAKQRGKEDKWAFNLQAPSIIPVLSYAKNRKLREIISRAAGKRAFNDDFDNQDIIKKIVSLKHERAELLGYKNHADYTLQERMAENVETVNEFLEKIYQVSYPKAKEEVEELKALAKRIDNLDEFMSWDSSYYSEILKKEKYDFNEEELKPYFKMENCIEGIFKTAGKLYGLRFVENKEVPVYHKDVTVYEVRENENDFVGLLYLDLFPRETKRDGAWMTSYRSQGLFRGEVVRPFISIVANLTPSTSDTPSLLNLREVETLFHEFGHALHGLLSDCTYPSLASPNVYWDFVELPSQIMENWVKEEETLKLFAYHYQTGELIPKELVDKVRRAEKFNKASFNIRQLNFGMLDMAWYSQDNRNVKSVIEFEDKAIDKLRLLPRVEGSCVSTSLSHIFAGGYSAGYYSYKWAEVLDADAFEKFLEDGIFNQETARSFRENVLARGNTEHPMDLYVRFRGRKPDAAASLRRDGLI